MKHQKIRLGDIVRHRTRPELGEGEVWELRASGRISVHWDKRPEDWRKYSGTPVYKNHHHYPAKNLEVLPKRTGIIFHGSPNEDPKVSKGCLLLW